MIDDILEFAVDVLLEFIPNILWKFLLFLAGIATAAVGWSIINKSTQAGGVLIVVGVVIAIGSLVSLMLVVVAGIGLISGVLTAMTSLGVSAIAGQEIGILLSGVVGLPFSLLILATLAEAFTQLRESQQPMVTS